jgi:hypothetical protein
VFLPGVLEGHALDPEVHIRRQLHVLDDFAQVIGSGLILLDEEEVNLGLQRRVVTERGLERDDRGAVLANRAILQQPFGFELTVRLAWIQIRLQRRTLVPRTPADPSLA